MREQKKSTFRHRFDFCYLFLKKEEEEESKNCNNFKNKIY